MNEYNLDEFKKGLKQLNLVLDDNQMSQFIKYYEILVEWNSFMNLTTITEFDEVILKHFLDSISIVKGLNLKKMHTVIDVGTGAGFPGIPLKIVYPHLQITLLDSLNKRIKFLNKVISSLHLKEINTIHGRAEDYAKQLEYRESYDLCVSRAVANLSSLAEYCLPYIRKGGLFVPYKSGTVEQEVKDAEKAIHVMGGGMKEIIHFQLLDTDMERSLVIIEKKKNTPGQYPRKAGLPVKEPIK